MKLAEALLERADLQKRIEALRSRIVANASYQEGETPTEDAAYLLDQCARAVAELERLVTAINLTNSVSASSDGHTITALLATRESLRTHHSVLVSAADAATGNRGYRQLRSELRLVSAIPVAEVRAQTDDIARRLRETDVLIQRTNWEVELLQN